MVVGSMQVVLRATTWASVETVATVKAAMRQLSSAGQRRKVVEPLPPVSGGVRCKALTSSLVDVNVKVMGRKVWRRSS